jgi:RNA polymerase sigma factor (sigma-70 family)
LRQDMYWSMRSDRELLEAIARCDGEAFTVFYRRHLSRVVAYLVRETGDRELAADLTAEVFAAALVGARRYRATHDTAVPWLLGIARNTVGASRRRGLVEARARRRLGFAPVAFEEPDIDRTDELLASLPVPERDAVRARVVDERAYTSIAAEMRCSELVVRKRVSRGLARLRKELKET